ncbi:hypothetical protein J19TS1_09890 [Heyndrickxia oleronia]|nr:hypothetical protein J19TS1_09890 [Heyndrickxia oleronia]
MRSTRLYLTGLITTSNKEVNTSVFTSLLSAIFMEFAAPELKLYFQWQQCLRKEL